MSPDEMRLELLKLVKRDTALPLDTAALIKAAAELEDFVLGGLATSSEHGRGGSERR